MNVADSYFLVQVHLLRLFQGLSFETWFGLQLGMVLLSMIVCCTDLRLVMMHSSISAAACVPVLLLPILRLLVVLCFHCYYCLFLLVLCFHCHFWSWLCFCTTFCHYFLPFCYHYINCLCFCASTAITTSSLCFCAFYVHLCHLHFLVGV